MSGSPPVIVNERQPGRQLRKDAAQLRVLPFGAQVAERHPRDEDEYRALTCDAEGEAYAVGAASVAVPRREPHDLTLTAPSGRVPSVARPLAYDVLERCGPLARLSSDARASRALKSGD